MRTRLALLMCVALVSAVALSGCTGQPPAGVTYKNDVITLEDYYVSNTRPHPGSDVTIEFLVQNNGEHPVERVKVDFFDVSGLTITELKCSGAQPEYPASRQSASCTFGSASSGGSIDSMDVRKVTLRLEVPDIETDASTDFTISYSVDYDYSGFRLANVPIVDGDTVTRASSKFSQSDPSYGPIALGFELPARSEHKENGQTVKEYWGVEGQPLELKMKFTSTATAKLKDASPVLAAGSVRLSTNGMMDMLPGTACDLCIGGSDGCPGTDPSYAYPLEDVKVPSDVSCDFEPVDFGTPEATATLSADFSYTYRYVLSEKLTVQAAS